MQAEERNGNSSDVMPALASLERAIGLLWNKLDAVETAVAANQTELLHLKQTLNETTIATLKLVQGQQDRQAELRQLCQEQFAEVDRKVLHADAYAQACQVAINFLSHHLMEVLAPEVLPHLQEFEDKMMDKLKRFDSAPSEDQSGKG